MHHYYAVTHGSTFERPMENEWAFGPEIFLNVYYKYIEWCEIYMVTYTAVKNTGSLTVFLGV